MNKEKEILSFHRFKVRQGQKREKHPKLIVDYVNGFYGHMGLTEEPKKGKNHRNFPLNENPEHRIYGQNKRKRKIKKSYLRRKIEYDLDDKFEQNRLKDYCLSDEDKIRVLDYVNKHKKR